MIFRHHLLLQGKAFLEIRRYENEGGSQISKILGSLLDGLSAGRRHQQRRLRLPNEIQDNEFEHEIDEFLEHITYFKFCNCVFCPISNFSRETRNLVENLKVR